MEAPSLALGRDNEHTWKDSLAPVWGEAVRRREMSQAHPFLGKPSLLRKITCPQAQATAH